MIGIITANILLILMNRFEYLTDRYAGFNIEHNIGSGLFRYIKLTRKLKFRQFWEAKGIIGDLSDANYKLNLSGPSPFQSLNNKMYLEIGTGVDNILNSLLLILSGVYCRNLCLIYNHKNLECFLDLVFSCKFY